MLDKCRFYAYHGVMPQEQIAGNEFEVSVEVNYQPVCLGGDMLESTVSYADIYEIVKQEMHRPRQLLETVAGDISDRILTLPGITSTGDTHSATSSIKILRTQVSITKITPPIAGINGSATVKLTRNFEK